jgi:AcrR family transcriptional regulator
MILSMSIKIEKDEVFWKVLNCAIELETKRGHQKWSITELSKRSGITRSLIYYYFGRSRLDILFAAAKIIGSEVFGLTQEKLKDWSLNRMVEAVAYNHRLNQRYPHLLSFYLTHRGRDSEIGEALRSYESQYFHKIQNLLPDHAPAQIEALWCLTFGLVVAPNLCGADRSLVVDVLKSFTQVEFKPAAYNRDRPILSAVPAPSPSVPENPHDEPQRASPAHE